MSRIGKLPVAVPAGVTITVDQGNVSVNGPKGSLTQFVLPEATLNVEDSQVTVTRNSDEK